MFNEIAFHSTTGSIAVWLIFAGFFFLEFHLIFRLMSGNFGRIFPYRVYYHLTITTHSPTLPLIHSSFSNLSVTSPTSQVILQPFPRFTCVTTHYPTHPLIHLRHSSFSNPSFASPTSQDFHLRYLASRP